MAIYTPDSLTALADVVRESFVQQQPIVPWGAGTRQYIGTPPTIDTPIVQLVALDRLLEHIPADMTVAVEAGMPIGRLQALLREHGQWLPWDSSAPPEATIGGLLATAASGPLRRGYGTPRDWLLGMRVVLGDGRVVKSGGRVVKNVAGYDSHKLHIGAFGTLGVIAEITFKVFPLPATFGSTIVQTATLSEALQQANQAAVAPLAPVSQVIQINPHAASYQLFTRYAGVSAGVTRQLRLAPGETLANEAEHWANIAAFARPSSERDIVVRAGVRPADLAALIAAFQTSVPNAVIVAHPGIGLLHARWHEPNNPALGQTLAALRSALQPLGGYVMLEHGPSDPALDRWGPPPATWPQMQALRARWDPAGILNRGRYF